MDNANGALETVRRFVMPVSSGSLVIFYSQTGTEASQRCDQAIDQSQAVSNPSRAFLDKISTPNLDPGG